MRAAVAALSAALDALSRLVVVVAGAALMALVAATSWMVFGRYVLNDTPTWVERWALLSILYIALPVAAVGIRERFHMSVEIVLVALPPGLRGAVRIATDLLLFGLGLVMMLHSWVLVTQMWAFNIPLVGLPQGLQFLPMTICGGLMALFIVEHLLRRIVGLPPLGNPALSLD